MGLARVGPTLGMLLPIAALAGIGIVGYGMVRRSSLMTPNIPITPAGFDTLSSTSIPITDFGAAPVPSSVPSTGMYW